MQQNQRYRLFFFYSSAPPDRPSNSTVVKQDDKIQNKNSDRGTRGHSLSEEHFCDLMTQMKPFGAFCVKTTSCFR